LAAGHGKESVVDEFVGFQFVSLDASGKGAKVRVVEKEMRRERVDLIARQFRDFLTQGDQSDTDPHGMVLTSDFKVRRKVGTTAGWVSFMVDRGDGIAEKLEEVALVVFARADDREGRDALKRLEPHINLVELPPAPVVVAVKLARSVPLIVSEWYGKSVAAFFGQ
jgi:hypothetical protein